ncbi:hypothetical protein NDK50_26705 [Paraburkholderia bryophila]|uniref:hypothetical protein n=1 Tax=Paraburkholderia bryophila TaxID=420952 RepID=UPI002349C3E6|nr:hypothetical protein [Paraburkholderia bryophila]WCM24406.1 hypothetical protein NDK50_26705 [Paraburkholderia bryophila]
MGTEAAAVASRPRRLTTRLAKGASCGSVDVVALGRKKLGNEIGMVIFRAVTSGDRAG